MWHGDWSKLNEQFSTIMECGKHQHNVVCDLKSSLWTFLTGVDKWYLRIRGLDPFLFGETYVCPLLNNWAKEGSLLPAQGIIQDGKADKHTREAVILVDTVIYHTTFMLHTLTVASATCDVLREKFSQYQKTCGELNHCFVLDDAIKCITRDELYNIVRKHLSNHVSNMKMGVAAFLIAYKLFDTMLETGEANTMIKEFQDEWNNEAKNWKDIGNEEYKEGQYFRAVASYTMAIKTNRYSAILYGNRAQAYLKLGKLDEAELDGRRVIILKPNWSKGYYRLAQSIEGQNRLHEAHCIASYGVKNCDETLVCRNMLMAFEEKILKKCKIEGSCNKKYKKSSDSNEKKQTEQYDNNPSCKSSELRTEDRWCSDVPDLTDSDSENEIGNEIICDVAVDKFDNTNFDKLKQLIKQGSENLMNDHIQNAIECFEKALSEIGMSPDIYSKIELEPICFKYALGTAYIASGSAEDIQKAIVIFNKIIKDGNADKFPAVYYGLSKSCFKLKKFKEGEVQLIECLNIIENNSNFSSYMWPCTTVVIEETRLNKLRNMIEELLEKCKSPPDPDAVCRYIECNLDKRIYYNDPHFKSFYLISCSDQCSIEYHSSCWKALKESLGRTDKEFLGQSCFTPDCESTITHIKIMEKEGVVLKQFDDSYKEKAPQKHRKNKLEKKFEQKAQRKRRRQESQNLTKQNMGENLPDKQDNSEDNSNTAQITIEDDTPISVNECSKIKESAQPTYTTASVPVCVLKKEQDTSQSDVKAKKVKERKKQKGKSSMSIEEFCDGIEDFSVFNEYKLRLKRLEENKRMIEEGNTNWVNFCETQQEKIPQLDPSRPFYIDKSIRDNPDALNAVLQLCDNIGESEEIRQMKESVFSYMEDFLRFKGPLHKTDSVLLNEIDNFPLKIQQLIADAGGLEKFLLNNMNFALVHDYICLLSDVLTVYSLPKYKKFPNTLDALDTFDDYNCSFEQEDELCPSQSKSKSTSTLNPHASEYSPLRQITECNNDNGYGVDSVQNENNYENVILPCDLTLGNYNNSSLIANEEEEEIQYNVSYPLQNEEINFIPDTNTKPKWLINDDFNSDIQHDNKKEVESNINPLNSGNIESDFLPFIPFDKMPFEKLIELSVSVLNYLCIYEIPKIDTLDNINKKLNHLQLVLHSGIYGDKYITITEQEYLEYQSKIDTLQDEKKKLEEKYSEILDSLTQLQKQYFNFSSLQKSLEDVTAQNCFLKKELNDSQSLLENKQKLWQQDQITLQDEIETLQQNLQTKSTEMDKMKDRVEELIQEKSKLQKELRDEIDKKNQLKENIELLNKKFAKLSTSVAAESLDNFKSIYPSPTASNSFYYPPPPPAIPLPQNCLQSPHSIQPSMPSQFSLFPPSSSLSNQYRSRPGMFTAPPPGLNSLHSLVDYQQKNHNESKGKFFSALDITPSIPAKPASCKYNSPIEQMESTKPIINSFSIPKESIFLATKDVDNTSDNKIKDSSVQNHNTLPANNMNEVSNKPKSSTVPACTNSKTGAAKQPMPSKLLQLKSGVESTQTSFERLMKKLQMQFPHINRTQLATCLQEYRTQHNNSLSGMTIDAIVTGVSALMTKNQGPILLCSAAKSVNIPRKLGSGNFVSDGKAPAAWANCAGKMPPWSNTDKNIDNSCSICLEDMTPLVSSFKVECGHSFHYKCIRDWVTKQSTCPICRIHILLPEEFPALGQQ